MEIYKRKYKYLLMLGTLLLVLINVVGCLPDEKEKNESEQISSDNYKPIIGYTPQIYYFKKSGKTGERVSDVQEELVNEKQAYIILQTMIKTSVMGQDYIKVADGISNWRLVDPSNITHISDEEKQSSYIFGRLNGDGKLDSHLIYIDKQTGWVSEAVETSDEITGWEMNNGGGESWIDLDQPMDEIPSAIPYPEGLLEEIK